MACPHCGQQDLDVCHVITECVHTEALYNAIFRNTGAPPHVTRNAVITYLLGAFSAGTFLQHCIRYVGMAVGSTLASTYCESASEDEDTDMLLN